MKCMDPTLCYTNASGKNIYRHFSLANPLFKDMAQQVFNCGKCIFCRKRKAYELAVRCVLHSSLYKNNCFLTLTYDETKEDYHNKFQYYDIQLFKKSLRSHCWRKFKKRIEVYNVHEYGKNRKKHWHLIVFNHDFSEYKDLPRQLYTVRNGNHLYTHKSLQTLWTHGYHTIGSVTEASALYQSLYAQKDLKHGISPLSSKKAHSVHKGIGAPYFKKHYAQILRLGYIPFAGKKVPIPRSFLKIADKHRCHFYEKSAFFDTDRRKRKYTPFKQGEENRHLANLYLNFLDTKKEYIKTLEEEWELIIQKHLDTKEKPDFLLSAENALHDLAKRSHLKDF